MKLLNPKRDVALLLGISKAAFIARRDELLAFLSANENQQLIEEATMRGALTVAVSDGVWNELKRSVGIT